MDNTRKNEIEAKLREMLERDAEKKAGKIPALSAKTHQPCNVIRRRKGEEDKRLYVLK
ncbi:hypothetical protein DENIS_2144 [Desulfonema ishimotonii]|uniref:Uncharacterized protein n=1 Tax=Desulfonema ishimotonii TaxID=45657 RepID=A0A401FW71_9BACT|nr:hypothetical protein [Desulfonema ishimotonii]GBC61184.1 hypothetical protein DENIS_2144 [Desulfonema ishimotonii]